MTQQSPFHFMPLNLQPTEAHRLFWNGQYFNLEAALAFSKQAQTIDELKELLSHAQMVLKLTPFANSFKSKLFAEITGEDRSEPVKITALTIQFNLFTKKVTSLIDIQDIQSTIDRYGMAHTNQANSNLIKLTESEQSELFKTLETLFSGVMSSQLNHPFVCFFEELLEKDWNARVPAQMKRGALLPFQVIFPFAGAIERVYEGRPFALDDLYCVTADCDCNEANCIVITFDEKANQEVGYAGFKYQFDKKIFKPMADFPNKINAQEWLKQFSVNQLVALPLLFQARYTLLRKLLKSLS